MSIGTPTIVANPAVPTGAIQPTSAAIIAGNLVVVAVCVAGNNRTATAVSDGTNTYTEGPHLIAGGSAQPDVSLWYKLNALAVASGANITLTISGGAPIVNICAAQVSGVTAFDSTGVGASNPTAGNSQSPSVTAGTLSLANEILFGVSGSSQYQATYTEASNFTNLCAPSFTGHAGSVSLGYKIVSSNSPITFAPSLSASGNWVALIAPFEGVASSQTNLFGGLIGV